MSRALRCDGCQKLAEEEEYESLTWYALHQFVSDEEDAPLVGHMCSLDCLQTWAITRELKAL